MGQVQSVRDAVNTAGLHVLHVVWPIALENLPLRQLKQVEFDMDPEAVMYFPVVQPVGVVPGRP